MQEVKLDIHNYDRILKQVTSKIEASSISQKNKSILMEYKSELFRQGLTKARISKVIRMMRQMAEWLNKDLDRVDKSDIQSLISQINENKDYSVWTKCDYQIIIKRFYKCFEGNNTEYPEKVKWLSTTIKKKDKPVVRNDDLLTEKDIEKLLAKTNHPRDKAIISLFWETGARVGEIGNMQVKDVFFDKYGGKANLNGKTGARVVRIISSIPYLAAWLDAHPLKERESPLWLHYGVRNNLKHMTYQSIRILIERIFQKAKVNKKFNPHIFRHSRASFLASRLTEFQMNQYFGWVQGSDMPSTYVKINGRDMDNAILAIHGIKKAEKEQEIRLKPADCPRCSTINASGSNFCRKCAMALTEQAAVIIEQEKKIENIAEVTKYNPELKEQIFQALVDMGLAETIQKLR